MTANIISKNMNKVLVIGPIYDKIDKLDRVATMVPHYDYIVLNGSLMFPYENEKVKERVSKMNWLFKTGKVIYNLDYHDLQIAEELHTSQKEPELLNWIWSKPNVTMINFKNFQTTTIITGGGVHPKMNKETLMDNLETSFISTANGISWHKTYGGTYGYIISNNPLTFEAPQFHSFSAQIGNDYGPQTQVYAQEVTGLGLRDTILL